MNMWLIGSWSVISGVMGGLIGAWSVGFRMGRWRQRVEDRLDHHEARLEKGNSRVDAVPILETKLDVLTTEVRSIRIEMRAVFEQFQTKNVCEAKHASERRSA